MKYDNGKQRNVFTQKNEKTYIYPNPIRSFPLPGPMNYFDLYKISDILVKLRHEEVNIEKIIELPALADHRIPEDVAQFHCVVIETPLVRKISNMG